MADDQDDQQTTDDRSADQETESDQQTSQDQVTDESAGQATGDQGDEQQTTDDQGQSQQVTDDQAGSDQTTQDQSQQTTDDQGSSQQTTEDQSQVQETTDDQSQDQSTTDDQSGSQQTTDDQSQDQQTTGDEGTGQATQSGAAGSKQSSVDTPATQPQRAGAGSSDQAIAPDKEYVDKVLTGAVGLSKVSEAAAIVAGAETVVEAIEPIGAVIEIVHMVLSVWDALETPDRTCGYQGLVYGLMYAALGKGDPRPNPTWPDLKAAPNHDKEFFEGVAEAKKRLANGQSGTRIKNLILLDVAKRGEKAVINNLWQHAIPDDDHLLRMYTIEWPTVGPNG